MDKEEGNRREEATTGMCVRTLTLNTASQKHHVKTRFLIIITFGFLVKLYCDGFFSLSSKQCSL